MYDKGASANAAATCILCETLITFCDDDDDDDSNMNEMHKKYEGNMVCLCGILRSKSSIIVKVIVHIFIPRYYMIYVNVCL